MSSHFLLGFQHIFQIFHNTPFEVISFSDVKHFNFLFDLSGNSVEIIFGHFLLSFQICNFLPIIKKNFIIYFQKNKIEEGTPILKLAMVKRLYVKKLSKILHTICHKNLSKKFVKKFVTKNWQKNRQNIRKINSSTNLSKTFVKKFVKKFKK